MHTCISCPLIQDEIKNRLLLYGYEDIKNNPKYKQEILDEIIDYCWCEKFGTKIWRTNSNGCDYEYTNKNKKTPQHNNKKKLNKRKRDNKYKNHLKYLDDNLNHYPSPTISVDKNGKYIHNINSKFCHYFKYETQEFAYYKRLYRGQRSKYLKKMSHKKVRRYKGELPQKGNWSNKLFDFWWEYD